MRCSACGSDIAEDESKCSCGARPAPTSDSMLLRVIQSAAISAADAKKIVANYRSRVGRRRSQETDRDYDARVADAVASRIVARYAALSAISGGTTALVGVVPGLGTILSALGGGAADTVVCVKLQVDMCMCLAEAYGWDLHAEDARHLSFLIAAGGTLEHLGVEFGTQLASKAGVNMLKQYLRGAALQAMKEAFKRIGLTFTRKALERAIPFGVGVVLGSTADYALTRYVGTQAMQWFAIDRDEEPDTGGALAVA